MPASAAVATVLPTPVLVQMCIRDRLRTADAAGVDAVVAVDEVTDWGNPNVVRASKGTVFTVPVASGTAAQTLAWSQARGIRLIVTTPETDVLHTDS